MKRLTVPQFIIGIILTGVTACALLVATTCDNPSIDSFFEGEGMLPSQTNTLDSTNTFNTKPSESITTQSFEYSTADTEDTSDTTPSAITEDTSGPVYLTPPVITAPVYNECVSDGKPEIIWIAVDDAVSYKLQLADNPYFTSLLTNTDVTDGTTYSVDAALSDGEYYVRVRAVNDVYLSTWSAAILFKAGSIAAPALVSPNDADITCSTEPTFSWESVAQATQYRVEFSNDDFSSVLDSEITDNLSVDAPSGLLSTGDYQWRVVAIMTGCESTPSANRTLTIDTPAAAPTNVNPTSGTYECSKQASLTWDYVSGALTYRVELAMDSDFDSVLMVETVSDNYMNLGGLDLLDDTYYWRVKAEAGECLSAASDTGEFIIDSTSIGAPTLDTPLDEQTRCNNDAGNTIIFTWSYAGGGSQAYFQLATDSTFDPDTIVNHYYTLGSSTTRTLKTDQYYWRVREVNSVGCSGPWSVPFEVNVENGWGGHPVSDSHSNVNARLNFPAGLAIDDTGEYMYVADADQHVVKKYTLDGTIYIGAAGGGLDGFDASVSSHPSGAGFRSFNQPMDVEYFNGYIYVADMRNHRIVKLSEDGTFLGYIGSGETGWVSTDTSGDGMATSGSDDSHFVYPTGLEIVNETGTLMLYIADRNNARICKWNADIGVSLGWIGGGTSNGWGSNATSTSTATHNFYQPGRIAVDYPNSVIYVSNWGSANENSEPYKFLSVWKAPGGIWQETNRVQNGGGDDYFTFMGIAYDANRNEIALGHGWATNTACVQFYDASSIAYIGRMGGGGTCYSGSYGSGGGNRYFGIFQDNGLTYVPGMPECCDENVRMIFDIEIMIEDGLSVRYIADTANDRIVRW